MSGLGPRQLALEEWILEKEGESLEFKTAKNRFDFEELTNYCVALANEGGGRIVLGVTDRRPRKIVGTRAFAQPERTRHGLCERIPLGIDFEEIRHPDCESDSRVLVFSVPSRPVGMAIQYKGRRWVRKGDSLVEMSDNRLREIHTEGGHDFSADPVDGLSLVDLNESAIEDFRRRWIARVTKADDQALAQRIASLTKEQLLVDAEAYTDESLNYAALVLFGNRAALTKHLAASEVVFEYRSSDASGPAQDRKEYREGFFGFYDELWKVINLRNDKQDFQEGLFVTPIATFSERPIREAILNAVSHRNYQLGGSIFIRQYPRRLEIDSPGGLPVGITLENILDRQNPRNRRIAEILTKCGLVERSGQGMNLIFEELIKQSKPFPDFARTDQYQFAITLHGTVEDPAFIRFVEKISKETNASFSTNDWRIMAATGRGEQPSEGNEKQVGRLIDLGVIERGKGRALMLSRRYYQFIGKSGAYTRRKGLDREQNLALLQKHVEENDKIGSRFEDLLDVLPAVKETTVRSLLQSLARQGKIHSVGRSRGARWHVGPGANLENED